MGALYNGDAILNGNLKINSDKPLDSGSVVQDKSDLTTLKDNLYNGKLVVSVNDQALFLLIDKTQASDLEKGWVNVCQVKTDGGGTGDSSGSGNGNEGGIVLPDNLDELIEKAVSDYMEANLKGMVNEAVDDTVKENIKEAVEESIGDDVQEIVAGAIDEVIKENVTKVTGTERFGGFTLETPLMQSAATTTNGRVVYSTAVNKFCWQTQTGNPLEGKVYSNWNGADRYHSAANEGGKDKVYIYNDTLYVFNDEGELVSTGRTEAELPENIQELIDEAVKGKFNESLKETVKEVVDEVFPDSIEVDDVLTETGQNPVTSAGIFKAITEKMDAKFVVLSELEYNSLNPKDPQTFYFIKK